MKFPNTVSQNTYRAYIDPVKYTEFTSNNGSLLHAINLEWDIVYPEPLRTMCIKRIADNWQDYPIFPEITDVEDKNYLLDIIDVNIPIKDLAAHITEDVFWKRCFQYRWRMFYPQLVTQPWICMFMEKYLSETLENMKPIDYSEESIQCLLDVCAPHLKNLQVNQLQPAMDEQNDHIPMDFILTNLTELRKIDLTYDLKSIGTNFFLGCSNISKNDIRTLASGLEKCYELLEFRLHSSKLEPYMLKLLARALEKACTNLELLSFCHCRCGDLGLVAFLDTLNHESFPNLKHLILTNNYITHEGAMELAAVIKTRQIETLDLRLNPIGSTGAAAIFGVMNRTPIRILNLSCCSIDDTITVLMLNIFTKNTTVQQINLSANKLGEELGEKISQAVFSRQLQELDLRNTAIRANDKWIIDSAILENRDKL